MGPRKYATATTIDGVCLRTAGSAAFKANPTLASGDVTISKNGGAFANLATLPTVTPAAGRNVEVALSSGEATCARALIIFSDQTVPAEWDDYELLVETFGHASAQYAQDYSAVNMASDVLAISGDTGAADNLESYTDGTTPMPVNATQISGDSAAADNAELMFDGTGYAGGTIKLAVNAAQLGGTNQTGRDIGLSVLLSSGTGTGQIDFTSGVVKANVTQFGGAAGTFASGRPEVNATHFGGTLQTAGDIGAGIISVIPNEIGSLIMTVDATAADLVTLGVRDWSDRGLITTVSGTTITLESNFDLPPTLSTLVGQTLWALVDFTDTHRGKYEFRRIIAVAAVNSTTYNVTIDQAFSAAVFTGAGYNYNIIGGRDAKLDSSLRVQALDGSGNAIAPESATTAIQAKTDQFVFTVANKVDANALAVGANVINAAALSADAAAEIAAAVETAILNEGDLSAVLEAIRLKIEESDDDLTTTLIRDAILNRVLPGNHDTSDSVGAFLQKLDALVGSRMATFSYTAPLDAAATRAAMGLATANLDTQLSNVSTWATRGLTMIELVSGSDYQLTTVALENAPTGGGGGLTVDQDAKLTKIATLISS